MPVSLGRYKETQSHKREMLYKRVGVIAGFALLLILLAGNAFLEKRQLSAQAGNRDWLAQAQQVRSELEKTEALLTDAETGQRGFLYTGDPKYLAPYNLAVAGIEPHLANLEQLTANNPRQRERIPILRSRVDRKLSELAETISLYRTGRPDEAKALVKSDAGLAAMNSFRAVVDQMENEETSQIISRTTTYQRSIDITSTSLYLVSLFAALFLILMAYYILWEMAQHEGFLHEIRRREEWYRVTLTSIGDAVIATNEHGKVTFLNPAAEALIGTSLAQDAGKDILEVFPIFNEITREAAENPVQKVMDQGRVAGLANHTVLKGRDGTLIPIEDSAAPIRDDQDKLVGVVLVFRDVTVERKSREVLYKTEKLAAAARLAASVAHEINNPLAAVVNLVYLAKAAPDAPPSVVQPLALAEQELERVAHITRQTLGFYRESSVPELVEMPVLIESVLKLYSNKLKNKNIAIEREFCSCPPILGMPGELKQVISNLISNAADAVGRDGTITVRTWCADEQEGIGVHLTIADDGPGIAAEDLSRIFEPFFTTKKDVGTGLGLWVTKEIVERHGGSIQAGPRNDGSGGAVISIHLPSSAEVPGGAASGLNG